MLLLCRHGETEANREHIIQGQSESDLTATGRAQAAALGQELVARAGSGEGPPLALTVYSSDLRRARDTARAAVDALVGAGVVPAGALRLATDERLRERRLGALQGRTAKESRGRWPQLWRAFQSDDGGAAAPCSSEPGADENGGIEGVDEVRRRAGTALAEIAAAHAGQRRRRWRCDVQEHGRARQRHPDCSAQPGAQQRRQQQRRQRWRQQQQRRRQEQQQPVA